MSPSPFVVEWALRTALELPPGSPRALDVAAGRGRHYAALASAGFRVFGVDSSFEALRDAVTLARAEGGWLRAWCADLTTYPMTDGAFDLVVVTRYMQRDLFPTLRRTVAPGGFVIYETFTRRQLRYDWGPTSPEHLLEPGELLSYLSDFGVVFYEERDEPEAVARLVARRLP